MTNALSPQGWTLPPAAPARARHLLWAALVLMGGSFVYSLACLLSQGRELGTWPHSLQRALIFGAAWWAAWPILARGLSPLHHLRRPVVLRLGRAAAWLLTAVFLCTSMEWAMAGLSGVALSAVAEWGVAEWGNAGDWLMHLHRRVPLALALSGLIFLLARPSGGIGLTTLNALEGAVAAEPQGARHACDEHQAAATLRSASDAPVSPTALRLDSHVRASFGSTWEWVAVAHLHFVKAAQNYVELHLADGRCLLMRSSLSELAERLPAAQFVRVHRSYLVRCDAIACLKNRNALRLRSGPEIPVGRAYWQSLMDKKLSVPVQRQ